MWYLRRVDCFLWFSLPLLLSLAVIVCPRATSNYADKWAIEQRFYSISGRGKYIESQKPEDRTINRVEDGYRLYHGLNLIFNKEQH